MFAIQHMIAQVSDRRLRERLAVEWANAAKDKKFGLLFEDDLPEFLPLRGAKSCKGGLICGRQGALKDVWQVKVLRAGVATCAKPSNDAHLTSANPPAPRQSRCNFLCKKCWWCASCVSRLFVSVQPLHL